MPNGILHITEAYSEEYMTGLKAFRLHPQGIFQRMHSIPKGMLFLDSTFNPAIRMAGYII